MTEAQSYILYELEWKRPNAKTEFLPDGRLSFDSGEGFKCYIAPNGDVISILPEK
jgi:hypothetical protein